jgi:hypothetical protein
MPPQTFLEDILYDGSEPPESGAFCLDETGSFRVAPVVGSTFPEQSTDRTPYLCEGAAVPPVAP